MNPTTIKQLLEAGLSQCTAIIEGDDGHHFTAIVVSPDFLNKNRIERQRLVYTTLKSQINDGSLHAISFKTLTPEEWRTSTTT